MKIDNLEVAKAIIAHEAVECFVGKQQPTSVQPAELESCVGGIFWGLPGEEWPRSEVGIPLIPWLQIVCTEMKELYGCFYRRQSVCFYIDPEFSESEATSRHDRNSLVVREYSLEQVLMPLSRPTELEQHKVHRVRWEKTLDYPSISKYYRLFEDSVYSAICKAEPFEYDNHSGIKIGGWPTPVQSDQRYPGEFDLQIDMTENYMYGDSGIGYLSRKSGDWYVLFECC